MTPDPQGRARTPDPQGRTRTPDPQGRTRIPGPAPRPDTFCVVYTIRNEEDLIADAVTAHRRLGAARIHIFFDGTTDRSREIAGALDGVTCHETLHPDDLGGDLPPWIARLKPHFATNMDVRKQVNTWRAARLAAQAGIGWTLSLDPDEILCLPGHTPAGIRAFWAAVPPRVDQVLLRNLELVAHRPDIRQPFREGLYFLQRFPVTEALCRALSSPVLRLLRAPVLAEWLRYGVYMLRFQGLASRRIRQPETGTHIPVGYFAGYTSYKSAIRSDRAEAFRFGVHKWHATGGRAPRTLCRGHVLHYDLPSPAALKAKFRQRDPAAFSRLFPIRHQLERLVATGTEAQVAAVFARLCITDPQRLDRMLRRGILARIDWVQALFESPPARTTPPGEAP